MRSDAPGRAYRRASASTSLTTPSLELTGQIEGFRDGRSARLGKHVVILPVDECHVAQPVGKVLRHHRRERFGAHRPACLPKIDDHVACEGFSVAADQDVSRAVERPASQVDCNGQGERREGRHGDRPLGDPPRPAPLSPFAHPGRSLRGGYYERWRAEGR